MEIFHINAQVSIVTGRVNHIGLGSSIVQENRMKGIGPQGSHNHLLAVFLNGLINQKRGKKEGVQPVPEQVLDNNAILKKLQYSTESYKSLNQQFI